MRELKFRCFYRGEMYPVDELHFSPDGSFSVGSIKMDLEGLGLRHVSPDSEHIEGIMQYVGLKDKTGKDIFDGDIVLIDGNKNTLVSWSNKYSSFVLKNDTWLFHHWFGEACEATDCEVVGNIHQHKHLLK